MARIWKIVGRAGRDEQASKQVGKQRATWSWSHAEATLAGGY